MWPQLAKRCACPTRFVARPRPTISRRKTLVRRAGTGCELLVVDRFAIESAEKLVSRLRPHFN